MDSPNSIQDEGFDIATVIVRDDTGRNEHFGPSTLSYESDTNDTTKSWYSAIYPNILRTCRTVYREAGPFLESTYYSETAFDFLLLPDYEAIASPKEVQRDGSRIFEYKEEHWQEQDVVAKIFRASRFAAFVNKIGAVNAAKITHLKIWGVDCDVIAEQMPLFTGLAKMYMPGPREVDVWVCENPGDAMDNSLDIFQSSGWENGQFWPMYRALEDFVGQITWLRRFQYDGQEDFGPFYRRPIHG